jgi:hypothetical protein
MSFATKLPGHIVPIEVDAGHEYRIADSSSSHPLVANSVEKVCDYCDVDQKHGKLN